MPCCAMTGIVDAAPAEQAAVDLRVQRLDAPVHDLGKPGVAGDLAHGDAVCGEQARRAAGGEDLDVARASARASSIRPVLSETDSNARRTGSDIGPLTSAGVARAGTASYQEPASPNCLSFLRSVPRLMPRMPAARLWLPSA